ncbi:cation-translocating P-type ATPase [Bradyrhizobium roseum]|uniref:cation-translocating P-type ATPase n=1 Tax=Bradyrhizobium roseum TaxID=3056648 RepID=UPI00261C1C00|nr:cation-translocating P-type ATPase [Bradyrhizobium roseus]WKA25525.1 cation-translocating P-type ATPase [Bradyrhizobium roseus]
MTPFSGLTEADAAARLRADGHNELPQADRRTPLRIAIEVLREPMLALLLVGGGVYLALGDLKEAFILLAFATMSILITVVQETRTERVLEALRDLTSPRALVIRDGERKRIAGRDVVRGDLIVLSEGDRVPADAILLQCTDLQADESTLTGESVPVRKVAWDDRGEARPQRPGGDDLPQIFSGSLVVRGAGLAEVFAIGAQSEIGQIGQSLASLETEPPRLQVQTRRVVRLFAVIGGAVCVLAVLLYGFMRGGWLDAVLAGIALGMSMLPEEFPVVLTVFMAMGAWRISLARVLTRRAAAIETLGSATVLCTDKTGTLTENRMTIIELRLMDGTVFRPPQDTAMPARFHDLIEFGLLASAAEPFDPMERAFHSLARERTTEAAYRHPHWKLVHAYGLRPDLLAVTHIWQTSDDRREHLVAAKGAPEAIAGLCRLKTAERAALTQSIDAMASAGLRVLGVARARLARTSWPASPRELDFEFMGLVGLADPLRATVVEAVHECRTAGIKAVMITGDYPATANAIAQQAGLGHGELVTGEQLERLGEAELASLVQRAVVFARISPNQKLRIVNAYKANGEIVAMTGDGVNDAPSLKSAHIGIAMGGRGTDVAREASAIVLLDDDFGSIVKSIRLGRRIYDNLRKAMSFIFAVHVPIAGLALLPLVLGTPLLFGPIHIALLEMVIDPVCSLVFEAETEEDDVMRRPPRAPDEPLFSRALVTWSLLQGLLAFAVVAAIYVAALNWSMPVPEVRALTFFSLIIVIVSLILVNRSFSASPLAALQRPNRALVAVLAAVTIILAVTLLWPAVNQLFGFGPLHANDLALTLGAGFVSLLALEMLKPLLRPRRQPPTRRSDPLAVDQTPTPS